MRIEREFYLNQIRKKERNGFVKGVFDSGMLAD